MSENSLPILIVDDARFNNKIIQRTLGIGGHTDVRMASSALEALQQIKERRAAIVIADWIMPEMDGLELSEKIRELDQRSNHYTHIIILTAKDGESSFREAFEKGVNDFISKSVMQEQLMPRVYAGAQAYRQRNELLTEKRELQKTANKLKNQSALDPTTGLGNLNYCLKKLRDTLRHTEFRNGATGYFLINVPTLAEVETRYSSAIAEQVVAGIAKRLRQIVRPLDTLAHISNCEFSVIMHFESTDNEEFSPSFFKRIQDSINVKAYSTPAGFINIKAKVVAITANTKTGIPEAEKIFSMAKKHMAELKEDNAFVYYPYKNSNDSNNSHNDDTPPVSAVSES